MELTGNIVDILPITSGVSKGGKAWKKQEIAIEIPGTYPKTVAFSLFGDKCENHGLTVGQNATIHINIESRKYNDRYFTEVSAWKIEMNGHNHSGNQQPKQEQRTVDPVPPSFGSTDPTDDLPF
jgi:hypothetical protein